MKSLLIFFLVCNSTALAQYRYELIQTSKPYQVSYEVEACESNYCYGNLTVWLSKKGRAEPFQEFRLETDFGVESGQKNLNRVAYRDQRVVDFTDVNFDGIEDLAIQNGREGGYSGPSYNIYLYSQPMRKFIYDEKLSSLATAPYLGLFEVDRRRRVLRTSSKSGCCMHETEEYKFIGGRVTKVFSVYEDSLTTGGKRVEITTRRLIGGKWRTTVRYEKLKQQEE